MAKEKLLSLEEETGEDPVSFLNLIEAQEPLTTSLESFDFNELSGIDTLDKQMDTAISLEIFSGHLTHLKQQDVQLDKHAAQLANVAIEGFYEGLDQVEPNTLVFSLESIHADKINLALALEGLQDRLKDLFFKVKEQLVRLSQEVAQYLNSFQRNLERTTRLYSNLKTQFENRKQDRPKFPYIKPESWCEHLCYLDSGFDEGLTHVAKDLKTFIKDHTTLSVNANKKYFAWLKKHDKLKDTKDLDTLKVSAKDFILPGAADFNQRNGEIRLRKDNLLYRSQELPGGKAFYTQIQTRDQIGVDGINMLANVDFHIGQYDPVQYSVFKRNLAIVAGLGVTAWLASINPLVASAAVVGSALTIHQKLKAGNTEESNPYSNKTIKIDKKLMCPTLEIEQIKARIKDMDETLKLLSDWNTKVLQLSWKNTEIDQVINSMTKNQETGELNGHVAKYLRNYAYSLLSLFSKETKHFGNYTFSVLNAMVYFTEKSLKQYS